MNADDKDIFDKVPAFYFLNPKVKRLSNKTKRRIKKEKARKEKAKLAPSPSKPVEKKFSDFYLQHLASEKWAAFRDRIIEDRGAKCERCGLRGSVQVHHKTYRRLGNEKPEDVSLYCKPCHAFIHEVKDKTKKRAKKRW